MRRSRIESLAGQQSSIENTRFSGLLVCFFSYTSSFPFVIAFLPPGTYIKSSGIEVLSAFDEAFNLVVGATSLLLSSEIDHDRVGYYEKESLVEISSESILRVEFSTPPTVGEGKIIILLREN